ncbi:MAG: hypothetical protein ABI333_17545 [bacterium]
MKKVVLVLGCTALLAVGVRAAHAQSLEDLELKKSQERKKALLLQKKSVWKDFKFGFLGIAETAAGINADRPEVSTLVYLAPQLKYKVRYRLQLNMGLYGYYLKRSENPWDLMDWSVQLSALNFFVDKKYTKIALSANLRYYIPMSKASRFNDRRGMLRALLKATRSVWKLYFGFEFMAYYHFAKYTTTDTDMVTSDGSIATDGSSAVYMSPDQVISNTQATLAERIIISYTPWKRLTLSFLWTWYQMFDYQPGSATNTTGSIYDDEARRSDVVEHQWSCIFDATFSVYKGFFVALGYSAFAPALQNLGKKVSYNPFDAKYGQVYLDLMMIY